jgi:ribosomal protein S18 acetylase RimI-like enzyme
VEGVRLATRDDLARIAELAGQAVGELQGQRGGEIWSRREARRQALHDLPGSLVLAGTIDDAIVGYAVARLEELADGRLLGVVDDIYVEPEARGVGVGEVLMDRLLAGATDEGCVGLDAIVLPGNRESKNFFERYGMTARAILVHRPLGPGARPLTPDEP